MENKETLEQTASPEVKAHLVLLDHVDQPDHQGELDFKVVKAKAVAEDLPVTVVPSA